MPPQPKFEERYDFRGGESRQRRQTMNQYYLGKNFRPKSDGILEVRKGRLVHGTLATSGTILSLFGRYTAALGISVFSLQSTGSNDKVYDNTTELTGPNLNLGSFGSIATYKDTVFFTNGVKPIQYHVPGTTVRASITGSPTPPLGSHMLFYKDRCFVGKDDGDIAYSDAGMFTTLPTCDFPSNNKVTLGSTGDGIKGLALGQDYLVAFRRKAYHVMTGTPNDDGGLGDMSWQAFEGIGTESPRSICYEGKRIAFLGSNRRPLMLEGSTSPVDLDEDDRVKEYFDALTPGSLPYVCGTFYGDELWFGLPQGPDKNTVLILVRNMTSGAWYVFSNHNVSFLHYLQDGINNLYGGETNGDDIYELESSYLDESSLIPIDFISREEALGSFVKEKVFAGFHIQMDAWTGESLTVAYGVNNTQSFTNATTGGSIAPTDRTWGGAVWGAEAWGGEEFNNKVGHFTAKPNPRGYGMRLRISGNASGGTRLLGYAIEGFMTDNRNEV